MSVFFIIISLFLILFLFDDVTDLYSLRTFKMGYNFYKKIGIINKFTYVYLNIKDFSNLNEVYGNIYGDESLKFISKRIKKELNFFELSARVSDDNFVFLLKKNNNTLKRLEYLESQIEKSNKNLSLLVGFYDIQNNSTEWVTSHSYSKFICSPKNKQMENNKINKYNESIFYDSYNQERLFFEYFEALKNKEFEVYYQGKYNVSGRIIGAEALVRWKHKDKGFLSPLLFIPLLERKKEISSLDCFVFESVCSDLQKLSECMDISDFKVAINLSLQSFENEAVIDKLFEITKSYKINPKNIEFELTESGFIDTEKGILNNIILKMHNFGFTIALDDFGTGYSSLKVLNNLPIDVLKIDKCFINDKIKSNQIVKSLIQMGHNLGLTVVAEGVEENEQLEFLKSCNCDMIQGYLFSKPIPWEDFKKLCVSC